MIRGVLQAANPAPFQPGGAVGATLTRPADLRAFVGSVDYYRARSRDFEARHPDEAGPDYYLEYGDRYMHRFVDELGPALSARGRRWLVETRARLQGAIEEARAHDPQAFDRLEQDPQRFRAFCYGTHPAAYVESGLGQLSPLEWVQIALTPDSADLLNRHGIAQVLQTTRLLAAERARDDMQKVRQNLPPLARALEATGEACQPLVARASQDLKRLVRPFHPCIQTVGRFSESALLACCPLLDPVRHGLWLTLNSLASSPTLEN